ncbi:response regulator [Pseudomonas gessardii]|uniref:Response regulator n=4 Tax=Pseudomonas TaxID=286 RepID=A0ABS9FH90_9PSED|nr:response regulator [Pseudomonas gessardii]MCF5099084.1 response regulator [Pseudomonas gessardii]MCF5110752.1 response regulator [Pseudomonas gessardii]NNA68303.1 response regulator [Pseudomonas gessardii]NNA91225.1 response regulator [Pseudomonas gessardii]
MMTLKVVLADDHPIVLFGVRMALENEPGIEVSGEAQDSTALVELMDKVKPDVLISDFYMPGGKHGDGLTLVSFVKRRYPDVKLIILTMMTNPSILDNIVTAGAEGVLLKSSGHDNLVDAIRAVVQGRKYIGAAVQALLNEVKVNNLNSRGDGGQKALSSKESEVMRLFVNGHTVSEIANMLNRSVKTISHQKISAQQKLGVANDKELYEYALRNGLL